MRIMRRLSLKLALLVSVFLLLWTVWWEPASLSVHHQTLQIESWPKQCQGITVAVLADLHIGSPYRDIHFVEELVAKTNQLHPDLILLPGDFVIQEVIGGEFIAPETFAPLLATLDAPMGVYAVLGNHDWQLDMARVKTAFETQGIPVLEDDHRRVKRASCQFELVGISDFVYGPHLVELAFSKVPDEQAILAFTHNPDVFPLIPSRASLTLAGHTHAGQVNFPFIGAPITMSQYGQRYVYGHIKENGQHFFVSSGIGTSIAPLRFRAAPEIALLTLNAAR